MKIGMANVFHDPDLVGGVEWYIKDISSYLLNMGHQVEVFTTSTTGRRVTEEIHGITVHRLPVPIDITYRARIWPSLLRLLAETDCDIIHCYDYLQFQTLATMLANAPNGCKPSVVTIFDVQHLVPRPIYKSLPIALGDRIASRLVSRSFDRILVRAPNLIDRLASIGFHRERMMVTQSGVRDELLDPGESESFREKHDLHGNLVMYLGRINPTKGLSHLIDAVPAILDEHPETDIVMIGPDERDYRSDLMGQIKSSRLESRVRFIDRIYELDEKRDALSACDVFVLPSSYEGTSQSVMQAMAQGRPVVTTMVGGLPYLIKNGFDGYLTPYGSPESLSSKICSLLANPPERRRMGKRAKLRAERQFRYSQLAQDLLGIYESVEASHGPS